MAGYYQTLVSIIGMADERISTMSEGELALKPSPGKWSKKEVLGHLVDSAYNNHLRILRAEGQGSLIFEGYDQDYFVSRNSYQKRSGKDILELWKHANLHLGEAVKELPESSLERQYASHNLQEICLNPPAGGQPVSLAYLIWDYLAHLEHHLAQIIPDYQNMNTKTFS